MGRILSLGGGGFSMEPENPLLDDFLLSLTRRRTGRPRVCFVPTASGDSEEYVERFRTAFDGKAETSVLRLFSREHADLRAPTYRSLVADGFPAGHAVEGRRLAVRSLDSAHSEPPSSSETLS
jgi:hypothetical protein